MNEQEIREQLGLMEMKIQSILRDIRHIRGMLDHDKESSVVTNHHNFFNALKAEDEHQPALKNNNGQ